MSGTNHLDYLEVETLLSFVSDHDPIVVGGQSVGIYAAMYEGLLPDLDRLGPLTSKDLDFFENERAAEALASNLVDGVVHVPGVDMFTPEAAKVTGKLMGKDVTVDFMRHIKGVRSSDVADRAVRIASDDESEPSLWLMHPVDRLRSRLANINELFRTDEHSVTQAEASVHILGLFLQKELESGGLRRVMRVAREMEHILTDRHFGRISHHEFGDRIRPQVILHDLLSDSRLDERWRMRTLDGIIRRCDEKEKVEISRRERFGPLGF